MNLSQVEEPELCHEVPPVMKRLAKVVAYNFYDYTEVAIVTALVAVPCIDEDSLIDKLKFDKRQLRQAIARLKADKLVTQRTHKQKSDDTGGTLAVYFYFINYNLFVNVVKYKLDHVRKKVESEEKKSRNRPSFVCQGCDSKFPDLEVDRLMDFASGSLKCYVCSGAVEEDKGSAVDPGKRSSLTQFNEQMEAIFKLLKACESITLAPEIVEPAITDLQLQKISSRTVQNSAGQSKGGWSTNRKEYGMYGQSISVQLGDEVDTAAQRNKTKEVPVWLSQSTVRPDDDSSMGTVSLVEDSSSSSTTFSITTNHRILSDLLTNEAKRPRLDLINDSLDDTTTSETAGGVAERASELHAGSQVDDQWEEDAEVDEDKDTGATPICQVAGEPVSFYDVTEDMLERMSPTEHDAYLKIYNEIYQQVY